MWGKKTEELWAAREDLFSVWTQRWWWVRKMETPEMHSSDSWIGWIGLSCLRFAGGVVEGTGLVTMAGKCRQGEAALPTNCFARDGWPTADVSYLVTKTKTWFLRKHCQRQPQHIRPSCCSSDCRVGNYTSASAHPISPSTAWGYTGNSKSIIIPAIKHKRRTNQAIISALRMQCGNKECHFYSTSPAVR